MATAILIATALWHALAVWHFTFFPERTLRRATGGSDVISAELFRFLGAMNVAFVVLALTAITSPLRGTTFVALAVANASQLAIDLRVRRLGLARGRFFLQVTIGDALFMVANLIGAVA